MMITRLDRLTRTMLIASALLLVPGIGQFVALRDLAHSGRLSDLALLFQMTAVFLVPTALILTGAILFVLRRDLRAHERLALLGCINTLIGLNLVWFFVHACSWAGAFGLSLKAACH